VRGVANRPVANEPIADSVASALPTPIHRRDDGNTKIGVIEMATASGAVSSGFPKLDQSIASNAV
jgi:hypothetical protein